jgi:ribosomal protein S18 acetylase RimI-like enzyme
MDALYEAERARWITSLSWDPQPSWDVIERVRRAGLLPGLILRDRNGAIAGWMFYLLHGDTLQIGGLTADNASATRTLLDAALDSPEASAAKTWSCFMYPSSTAFEPALQRRRFSLSRYLYMQRELVSVGSASPRQEVLAAAGVHVRQFATRDTPAIVRLIAAAFKGQPSAGCFAPHGALAEWVRYVSQLQQGPGCGMFQPEASFVVQDQNTGSVLGAILTTRLAAETAHVAQVAVDARMRGQGIGECLVETACSAAEKLNIRRMTLLVSEDNAPARRLYERLGFVTTTAFIYGTRPKPTRVAGTVATVQLVAG